MTHLAGRKVLLVGEAPVSQDHNEYALYPYPERCAGWNLWKFTGISRAQYLRVFDRTNVFSTRQARTGKGRAFPVKAARVEVIGRMDEFADRPVVLVGSRVASSFKGVCIWEPQMYYFTTMRYDPLITDSDKPVRYLNLARVHHTSGINAHLNRMGEREKMHMFMRTVSELACTLCGEEPEWMVR